MKTTVDIADPLLRQARRLASRRGTTLKAIIEAGLRAELTKEQLPPRQPVRTHTFGGKGLQQGLDWGDWAALRSLAYQGRGG